MSAHTPGPWEVDPLIAKVNQVATLLPLAIMQWPSNGRSERETKANACLIAAAPELLEALKFARALLGAMPINQIDRAHKRSAIKMMDASRAPREYLSDVIAKAKGESHE